MTSKRFIEVHRGSKMNSKQKAFTIRVPTELYENVSEMAESLDISITQVVRAAITQYCIQSGSSMNASGSTVNANGSDSGSDGEDSTHFLQQQLESKDTQISELHRLLALQSEHNVLLTTKESLFGRIRGFFTGSKVIGSGM
ncbi:TPA: CopG family transcriptional regulator [Candidatus Poribacteria bacterium]|nr:CopG family transcriptional regulator [Candidatus Poribacteria bacterium]